MAPTGFGKSILAAQLQEQVTSYENILFAAPHETDLISAEISMMSEGGRRLLIIDNANANCLTYLSGEQIPAGNTVMTLGREDPLPSVLRKPSTSYLSEPELRFSYLELVELSRRAIGRDKAESLALLLESMTEGWPEHVVRVLGALSRQDYLGETAQLMIHDGEHLDELIARCMNDLEAEFITGLEQLAHLPAFSASAANAFVPGLIAEANRVGFPLLTRQGGTIEIPALLREHLMRDSEFSPESARILAPLLVATLGVPETLGSLLSAGAAAAAAEIVCQISPNQLAATNQTNMLGILRAIESAEPDNPNVLLRRAWVHRNLAQLKSEREAIVDALSIAKRIDSAEDELAAEVALLRAELRVLNRAEAEVRLTRLEESIETPRSPSVSIGLRELRAMVLEQKADLQSIYRSIELLAELASEWEHLGDRAHSALLLRMMAAGPLNTIGDYQEAKLALDKSAKLVWDNPMGMAATSQLLCRFLALVGDADRFATELPRATGLIDAVDLRWLSGYLDWAVLHASLWQNDTASAESAYRRAVDRLGELATDDTGVIFFAESAAVLAVLGSVEMAQECLTRSIKESPPDHIEVAVAAVVVAARCGDASTVSGRISALKSSGNFPHERVWRLELEQLVADQRLGAANTEVSAALNQMREACKDLGLVSLFDALSAGLATTLDITNTPAGSSDTQIDLMGGFTVTTAGEILDLAPGHVTKLLKLLAVRGKPMAVESVVAILWPEAELSIGKRRLKNVVSRLRAGVDTPIIARLGERISLAENVATDVDAFRTVANAAVRPNDGRGLGACLEALNLYKGHLLPTDLYDDEFTRERDALRAVALSVLEIALVHAPDGGVSPAWLLQTALRLEPDSEAPFLRIEAIADSVGATECAAAAHSQAESLAQSLGIALTSRD